MKVTKADLRLYAITDRQWLGGKDFYMVVEQVLKNGATFLQLREKNTTHEQRVEEAKKIKQIAAKYHVPFVVNDDIWAAKEAGRTPNSPSRCLNSKSRWQRSTPPR